MNKLEKNEMEINGKIYVEKDSIKLPTKMATEYKKLPFVIIRSYAAGVHFGYLKSEKFTTSGKVVFLVKTRRVWYWDGAASISQMAIDGVNKPENCKIAMELESNEIVNVIETIPCTEKAMLNLQNLAIWKN